MTFKIGSLVKCIDDVNSQLQRNNIYTVVPCVGFQHIFDQGFVHIEDESGRYLGGWFPSRFRLHGHTYIVTVRSESPVDSETTTIHAMNDADAITQIMKFPDIRNGWRLATGDGERIVASWGYDND